MFMGKKVCGNKSQFTVFFPHENISICSSLCGLCFRFHTLEHTWQYTISIYDCTVISGTQNSSSSRQWQAATTDCPLRLATRAFALPDWNPEHSDIVNCSSQSTGDCMSTVTQPATNAWNYILLESLVTGTVNFTLSVSTEGKSYDVLSV